jgi:hypothetical protein
MSMAETIRDELVKVFTEPQADVLTSCVIKAHDTLATRSDMHELRVAMKELADQQKETSAEIRESARQHKETCAELRKLAGTVSELSVQQKETSAEVRDLARQQKETNAELKQLVGTVSDLALQQKETSAELKQLAGTVSDLAVQQKETSAELKQLVGTVSDLAVQQKETSAELKQLAGTVSDLAVQQKETSAELKQLASTVSDLAVQQNETRAEVRDLTGTVRTLSMRTDTTAGWALEWLVGKHLPAYVGRRIRRCRVVGAMDVVESLEDEQAGAGLSVDDIDELRRADLIATGTIDGRPLYLVGEVSFTADNDDVLRAARRAAVMRKAGQEAQAFVACDAIDPIPAEMARREGVWVIRKGRLLEPAA